MICPRCLLRQPRGGLRSAFAASPLLHLNTFNNRLQPATPGASTRTATTSAGSTAKDARTPIPADIAEHSTPNRSPPAATSTSAAQPFSAHAQPSPKKTAKTPYRNQRASPEPLTSAVPAGAVLRGINYFKNKEDPVAREDSEYPAWLWTLLSERRRDYGGAGDATIDARLYSKSAEVRRAARKRARLEAKLNADENRERTPVYEQSIDLPAAELVKVDNGAPPAGRDVDADGGATAAAAARRHLTMAMRHKRKKAIQETNFLKSM